MLKAHFFGRWPQRNARWLALAALVTLAACGGRIGEYWSSSSEALSAIITVSGVVTDANGLPLSGVTVVLAGSFNALQVTTTTGTYAFTGLNAGSYSVRPTLNGCNFTPDVVNLNNLSSNAVQNFAGSGPTCGGTPTVNSGATSGSLTITGHLRDPSGNPIVGAEVTLGGSAQALRFSDLTGAYSFSVDAGSYSMNATASCPLSPANVNLNNVHASVVQDFVGASNGCVVASVSSMTSTGSVLLVSQNGQSLGTTYAHVEARASAADALARLQQIVAEQGAPVTSLTIAGFPALERTVVVPIRGGVDPDFFGTIQGPLVVALSQPPTNVTTAIAMGSTVVRFESQLPNNASASAIQLFLNAGRDFSPLTLTGLHGPAPTPVSVAPAVPPATPPSVAPPTTPGSVTLNEGELEIAASDSANAVVYATQNAVFNSSNNGATVESSTINFAFPSTATSTAKFGDPTTAVGAPNLSGQQAFWYAQLEISSVPTTGPLANTNVLAIALYQSVDNGVTFNAATNAFPVDCTTLGCTVPDQPHMAVDRVNQATVTQQRFDQVYLVWRNFASSGRGVGVACTKDGKNWTIDLTTLTATGSDFPRINVAHDGSVFVVYSIGDSSAANYQLMVQNFSSCASGMVPQFVSGPNKVPAPNQAASVTDVADLAGLDRPANANYMIAPDTTDSSGQRVFVTYMNETSSGHDDLHVAESLDGARSWPGDVIVNTTSSGSRFFPWLCTTNGTAYVSWYDRRDATTTAPDLTAYYRSSVVDTGTLNVGAETNVSGVDDVECNPGFPQGARSSFEETGCSNDLPGSASNPVTAGECCPSGSAPPCSTSTTPTTFCDFRFPSTCPSGTVCQAGDPSFAGGPKYGDYNGNGCAQGVLYMAWSSTTAPVGLGCSLAGTACTTSANCCSGSGTCVGSLCSPSGSTCTANGSTCTSGSQCCAGSCVGGTCLPNVAVFEGSSAVVSCTTGAPDVSPFTGPFDVDTGLGTGAIGANYGNGACTNQFLTQLNLTQPAFTGQNVFVGGGWSVTLPATPCNEQATMDVFVNNGVSWQLLDQVTYSPVSQGGLCLATATSHTNAADAGLGGVVIPASSNFQEARVAIEATQGGTKVPVLVFAQVQ
jgi:hypothetical protein